MTAIIAQQGPTNILAPADRTRPTPLAVIAEEPTVEQQGPSKEASPEAIPSSSPEPGERISPKP
jgi:hypothetical protein